MTGDPLFPPSVHPSQVGVEFWPCLRCGLLAWDKGQHRAWHASVDTAATTKVSVHTPTLEFFRNKADRVDVLPPGTVIKISRTGDGSLEYTDIPPGEEPP